MSTGGLTLESVPLHQGDSFRIVVALAAIAILYYVGSAFYSAFFGPLARIPGPKWRALSVVPYVRTLTTGRETDDYPALHQKYGPVVRIAPNEVSFAGGAQVSTPFASDEPICYHVSAVELLRHLLTHTAIHRRGAISTGKFDRLWFEGSACCKIPARGVVQSRKGYALATHPGIPNG